MRIHNLTKTQYNTIHQYRLRNYPKSGVCEFCNELKKTQWANVSGEYEEENGKDWFELCFDCHYAYDRQVRHYLVTYAAGIERLKTYAWFKG